jgi:RNA polymerase sigma-54 factor
MADLKLNVKLVQQLVMTPQLQQAIKLLQMSRLELEQTISQEILENPVLEEGLEITTKPVEESEKNNVVDSFDWDKYAESYNVNSSTPGSLKTSSDNQFANFENFITKTENLYDHLLWQLRMTGLSTEEESFGKIIIEHVDEDGYLDLDFRDLVSISKTKLTYEEAEEVLLKIQEFDPVGIASRNLKECLMQQIRHLDFKDGNLITIVKEHLDDFEKRNYKSISKKLDIAEDEVVELSKIILSLEPKPGRAFSQNDIHYIVPDVYITKVEDQYVVNLNDEGIPNLKINAYYKRLISEKSSILDEEKQAKDYIKDKIKSAVALIKSLQHRQKTIYKVTEAIANKQKDFLDHGISKLKPMILREIAEEVNMHESTISRVTTNKYVHTPQGIFELKYFFNNPVSSLAGSQDVASESARELIKSIITNENSKNPYSDQQIVEELKKHNIDIARRTVAKYREMLGLLPSSKRKKYI